MLITKENVKLEIDCLDERYLELVYRILQQFPRLSGTAADSDTGSISRDPLRNSHRICYDMPDDFLEEGKPFAQVKNAAEYGKALRTRAWQRGRHE